MPRLIQVERPGLLTTVQDLGRVGFQRFGLPVGGAMDRLALRLANRLIGNPDDAAGLEITITGPELTFLRDTVLALTGADLSPRLNDQPLPMWEAVAVQAGARLTFGSRRLGARTYLAVTGGLQVPRVLGSRSTHLRSGTGGLQGRALAVGDGLAGGEPSSRARASVGRIVPPDLRPVYGSEPVLRAVRGPQADRFLPAAIQTLTSSSYRVTPQSDRMGYRLEGPPLPHAGRPEIISDATPAGSLQVPASRQPILLMADHQTTGGYPKIAVVISADLPLAAQLAPGDTLRITLVPVEEARAAWQRQEVRIAALLPSRLPVPVRRPKARRRPTTGRSTRRIQARRPK